MTSVVTEHFYLFCAVMGLLVLPELVAVTVLLVHVSKEEQDSQDLRMPPMQEAFPAAASNQSQPDLCALVDPMIELATVMDPTPTSGTAHH